MLWPLCAHSEHASEPDMRLLPYAGVNPLAGVHKETNVRSAGALAVRAVLVRLRGACCAVSSRAFPLLPVGG